MSPEERKGILVLHERLAVLEAAVTALISTHPNPDQVQSAFLGLYAKHQAARAVHGADPAEAREAVRGLLTMLFQRAEKRT